MALPLVDLSDSFISRTLDRSSVSEGVSASESVSEFSDDGELEEPVQLVVNYFEGSKILWFCSRQRWEPH